MERKSKEQQKIQNAQIRLNKILQKYEEVFQKNHALNKTKQYFENATINLLFM